MQRDSDARYRKQRIVSYLEWVVSEYGEDEEVMSTNCAGKPYYGDDYCLIYGKAGELLKEAQKGNVPYIPL